MTTAPLPRPLGDRAQCVDRGRVSLLMQAVKWAANRSLISPFCQAESINLLALSLSLRGEEELSLMLTLLQRYMMRTTCSEAAAAECNTRAGWTNLNQVQCTPLMYIRAREIEVNETVSSERYFGIIWTLGNPAVQECKKLGQWKEGRKEGSKEGRKREGRRRDRCLSVNLLLWLSSPCTHYPDANCF
jgi:hypothetical protein